MKRITIFLIIFLFAVSCVKPAQETATSLNVKTNTFSFTFEESKQTLSFVANKDWKIVSSDSWCIVSQSFGTLNDTEVISVDIVCLKNDTYDERSAELIIICGELSEFITIIQGFEHTIILSKKEYYISNEARTLTIDVKNNEGYTLSVSSNCDWLSISQTKALASSSYIIKVKENTSVDERVGYIIFEDKVNKLSDKIKIVQSQQNAINLDKDSYDAKPEGEILKVIVSHNVAYIIDEDLDWISQSPDTKTYISSDLYLEIEPNETNDDRTGTVKIASTEGSISKSITINQKRIYHPVTNIELNVSNISGNVGDNLQLIASIVPDNATNKKIEWSSTNTEIATINNDGLVNLVGLGNCTIIVSAADKTIELPCEVTGYSSATCLSDNGTANCYVVNATGVYKFIPTKGNETSAIEGDNATVLWRTYNSNTKPNNSSVINGVLYKDGYIWFSTESVTNKGNAVIVLKDKNNKVLWSWHIWVALEDVFKTVHTYANNAGIMMDRNLGSLSATIGDPLSIGLVYEWGRKDPFTGPIDFNTPSPALSDVDIKIVTTKYSTEESGSSLKYSIEHPDTYIYNSTGSYDWQSINQSECNTKLWNSKKTIYDPCPAGWRVPDGGKSGLWAKSGIPSDPIFKAQNHGAIISSPYCDSDAWYPSVGGGRQWNSGNIMNVGEWGNYWSCTFYMEDWMITDPPFYNSYRTFVFYSEETRTSDHSYGGQGHVVRCCKE